MASNVASPEGTKLYDVKACRNCAQSKTKCVPTNLSATHCDRCHRLKKQCVPQTPHKRKPRAAARSKNRITELERRLDRLSRSVRHDRSNEPSEAEASQSPPITFAKSISSADGGPAGKSLDRSGPSKELTLHTLIPDQDEDIQICIEIYRNRCACFFPFVLVPDCSIRIWKEKHPFLLGSICLAASYKDRLKQARIATAIMEDACTTSMLRGEKSLDLLQGLMVYMSWYQTHFVVKSQGQSQVCNLLAMSTALVADLGLNRPSHQNDRRRLTSDSIKPHGSREASESFSTDEQLALLGCFYMSVVVCVCFKRLDAMPYTSHIDNVRKSFLAENDSLQSSYVDHLIRIQVIAYQIDKAFPYSNPDAAWQFTAPVGMHVEALRAEIISFRDSIPAVLKQEPLLAMNICTAEIYLHEISLYDLQWRNAPTTQFSQRVDMLFECLQSTKRYCEVFCSISDHDFKTLSWYAYSQLGFAILICSRLSTFELQGWNLSEIEKTVDFSAILDSVIKRLQAMNELAKVSWTNGQDDLLWCRVAQSFARMKAVFDKQKAERHPEAARTQQLSQVLSPLQQQQPVNLEMGLFSGPTFNAMDQFGVGGDFMEDWLQGWPEMTL